MKVTRHELAARMLGGRIDQLHEGVYYFDCVPATWKTEVRAAVFACGRDAVASHRCAAELWGFDGFSRQVIEITVPYLKSPDPPGTVVHRSRRYNAVTSVDGIPVTTPEKTIFDLASMLPDRVLQKVVRSAVAKSLVTSESLDTAIARYGGRGVKGTRRMRRVVHFVEEDRSGSWAEVGLKAIIDELAVPPPVQQLCIELGDGTNAYSDFAWPELKKIVEVDGFEAHGSPGQLESDLRRQNFLLDLGWQIRRFTATQIRDDPSDVASRILRFVT